MGYETRVYGRVEVDPPIPWGEVRDSAFLSANARRPRDGRDVKFILDEREVDTPEGVLLVRNAVALRSTWESGATRVDNIVAHTQEVIDAFPDRSFTGRFNCFGEENEDIWRLEIHDRRATRVQAKIVWPDGTEGVEYA